MREAMTLRDIEELAATARMELTIEERNTFPGQIMAIMGLAESLAMVDTAGIAPTVYPMVLSNPLREDVVEQSLAVADALANGPDVVDGYFRVPRIIEEEE